MAKFLIALTCSLWPLLASAENLTLDEVVAAALVQSPIVAELDASLAASEREARDIAVMPNPELDAEQQFYAGGAPGATENQPSINLIQPFKLSHFGLRNRVRKLKEEAANQGRAVELVGLVQRVRTAFAHVWILTRRKSVLDEVLARALRITSFIEKGFREAAFGRGERDALVAETARLDAELRGLNAELSRAHGVLIGLTGISPRDRVLTPPVIAPVPADLMSRFDQGALHVQKQMELLRGVATEELALAHRDSFPELRPRLVYSHTNDGGEFFGAGISIPLPFSNRNQNAIHQATAQAQSAERIKRFFRSDAFKGQLREVEVAVGESMEQLEIYEKTVIPGFRSALNGYEELLRSGQGTVLQVWQTLTSLNESNARFAELWTKAYSERAELGILIQEDL